MFAQQHDLAAATSGELSTSQLAMHQQGGEGPAGPNERPHTLEQYSYDYFRPPPKRTLTKTLSLRSARSS